MIRRATVEDQRAITRLESACFDHDAWGATLVEQEIREPTRVVQVSEDEGAVHAYASIMTAAETADLLRIAVDPARRGRGYARELLSAQTIAARARGAKRMLLEVADSNAAARGLYTAFGFEQIAIRPHYYADGCAAVVMELQLA